MAVIGIDLGYQTSLIAAPRGGGIDVLLNDYSQRQTASVVSFSDKQRILGESARMKFVMNFKNTVAGFKHLIGRKYQDPEVQEELSSWGYRHQEMPDGTVGVLVRHMGKERMLSVVQIFAMFLGKLREFGETNLKTKVPSGVIGVPVWYTDAQRHALLEACRIANFTPLKLLNETSAVALSYGIYKQDLPAETETPRRVIFVDFGHSQLQVSACELVKGKLTVLGTAFDNTIGGRSFDRALAAHLSEEFKVKYKLDVKANPRATLRLEQECEKLKKQMSSYSQALPLNIECFMEEKDVAAKMSRDEFEKLCTPILAKVEATLVRMKTLLAELKITDVFAVEVLGGASRIPAVKALITKTFGMEISTTLNLDEAVARGCALSGAILSPTFRVRDFAIHDKTPYAMTLNWQSGVADEGLLDVFGANGATGTKLFSLNRDGPFDFGAAYKEPAKVPGHATTIGNYKVEGVTPSFDGEPQKVKIKVKLDEHGCFVVESATLLDKLPVEPEKEAPMPMDTDKDAASAAAAAAAAAPAAAGADGAAPAAEGAAPMDTDDKKKEKDEESKKKEEKKAAKTHKQVTLSILTHRPHMISNDVIARCIEEELEMQAQDRLEVEKSIARNSLEEYIFDMRDKLGSIYEDFIQPEERENFSQKLDSTLDWLSNDAEDESKSAFVDKLNELRGTGKPLETRHTEAQKRPEAEEALRQAIVHFRKFVDEARSGNEKYAHIDAKLIDKVATETSVREAWLAEKTKEQEKKAKHEMPAVLAAAIMQQREDLVLLATPVVSTPKPKVEPPKVEPAKAEAPKAEAPKADAPAAEAAPADAPNEEEKKEEEAKMETN